MMIALSRLTSYDVFSLRIALREPGIEVNDLSALQLSDAKKAQLTVYMKNFTAPLIRQIFGQAKFAQELIRSKRWRHLRARSKSHPNPSGRTSLYHLP